MFFDRGTFVIGDGMSTLFWEDTLLGMTLLSSQYPSLYNIMRHKNVTVVQVLSQFHLNIEFRRDLLVDKWITWLNLVV